QATSPLPTLPGPAPPQGAEGAGGRPPEVPGERPGPRRALVAAGAAALLVAAGLLLVAAWRWPSWGQGPPDGGPGRGEAPVKLEGHEALTHDFALKVEMSGGAVGRAGVRLLSAGEEVTFRIEVERD